jgi:hypothetical protein
MFCGHLGVREYPRLTPRATASGPPVAQHAPAFGFAKAEIGRPGLLYLIDRYYDPAHYRLDSSRVAKGLRPDVNDPRTARSAA